jgi:hypothetical protein
MLWACITTLAVSLDGQYPIMFARVQSAELWRLPATGYESNPWWMPTQAGEASTPPQCSVGPTGADALQSPDNERCMEDPRRTWRFRRSGRSLPPASPAVTACPWDFGRPDAAMPSSLTRRFQDGETMERPLSSTSRRLPRRCMTRDHRPVCTREPSAHPTSLLRRDAVTSRASDRLTTSELVSRLWTATGRPMVAGRMRSLPAPGERAP